jgi:1-acyl-sn-glycerol-3-phosphate acyltransferase
VKDGAPAARRAGVGPVLRGVAFYALLYGSMGLFGALFFPVAVVSAPGARACAKIWLRMMFVCLRVIGGVRTEIRGTVPHDRVLVAAKHQSMLDVFMIVNALPEGRFVMKRELLRTPVFGWYATRLGAVPVDRGGGGAALREMTARMLREAARSGQIVIYPQGTRVKPGAHMPYKIGVHALYDATGLPCVPVATNSGLSWPKGVAIHPGLAVAEFLPALPPDMERGAFMARVERVIESASDRLAAEWTARPGGRG